MSRNNVLGNTAHTYTTLTNQLPPTPSVKLHRHINVEEKHEDRTHVRCFSFFSYITI